MSKYFKVKYFKIVGEMLFGVLPLVIRSKENLNHVE